MHGGDTGLLRRAQQLRGVEVGPGAAPGQRDGHVGAPDVQAGGVVLGEDRDRAQAEVGRRAQHADRDLAAVRDEDAVVQHR